MDAGLANISYIQATRRRRGSSSPRDDIDRFIPNRASMDFDYAHSMLTTREGNAAVTSSSSSSYANLLAQSLNHRTRIFSFRNNPPSSRVPQPIPIPRPPRSIPQKPDRTLDAPGIANDFNLNVLDWGSNNILSIALQDTIYLWDASNHADSELVTVDEGIGPVTSVKWAPDGHRLAVGLNNSDVQLWDSRANKLLKTLRRCHSSRVGALDWNGNHILTTGGMDGQIVNHDVRIRDDVVGTYGGHSQEVCGLRWSPSGQQLASGGQDNVVHIWDSSVASSNSPTQWLHSFEAHTAAVKALAWCPFQESLLASGEGGLSDGLSGGCIKFWNTNTGACLNSIETRSQVCSLLWNRNERELLSSHGLPHNQLTLWKYPSMAKVAELTHHTSRVLFMSQSPDGSTVASAAADERLNLWNVFGTAPAPKAAQEPFARFNRILIR